MSEDKMLLWLEEQPGFPLGKRPYAFEGAFIREGLKIDIAETAKKAIEKLKEQKYCAVILDLMLPAGDNELGKYLEDENLPKSMSGITVLKKITDGCFASLNSKELPVVVVSGVIVKEVVEKAYELLGEDAKERFFGKPINPYKVAAKIIDLISKQ